jgi:ribosome-binding factor A
MPSGIKSSRSASRTRASRLRAADGTPPPGEAPGHRHARLEQVLHEELNALARDELSDPRLDGVQFTSVALSVDYRSARVGYAPPQSGPPGGDPIERALARATPFLRARLAEAVSLKFVPALRFVRDASFDVDAQLDADPDPIGG